MSFGEQLLADEDDLRKTSMNLYKAATQLDKGKFFKRKSYI